MVGKTRDLCLQVFGKRQSSLSDEEQMVFRRASRLVCYYRKWETNVPAQRQKKRDMKLEVLASLGIEAKCQACGYDRYIGCLEFHHRDRASKVSCVGHGNGGYTLDECVKEARKCALLCRNCHMESHVDAHGTLRTSPGRPREVHDPKVMRYLDLAGVGHFFRQDHPSAA